MADKILYKNEEIGLEKVSPEKS